MNKYSQFFLYTYLLSALIITISPHLNGAATVITRVAPPSSAGAIPPSCSYTPTAASSSSAAAAVTTSSDSSSSRSHEAAESKALAEARVLRDGAATAERTAVLIETARQVKHLLTLIDNLGVGHDRCFNDELKIQFLELWRLLTISPTSRRDLDKLILDESYANLGKAVAQYIETFNINPENFYKNFNLLFPQTLDSLTSAQRECVNFALLYATYLERDTIEALYKTHVFNDDISLADNPYVTDVPMSNVRYYIELYEDPTAAVFLMHMLLPWKIFGLKPRVCQETFELLTFMHHSMNPQLQDILRTINSMCEKSDWPTIIE